MKAVASAYRGETEIIEAAAKKRISGNETARKTRAKRSQRNGVSENEMAEKLAWL